MIATVSGWSGGTSNVLLPAETPCFVEFNFLLAFVPSLSGQIVMDFLDRTWRKKECFRTKVKMHPLITRQRLSPQFEREPAAIVTYAWVLVVSAPGKQLRDSLEDTWMQHDVVERLAAERKSPPLPCCSSGAPMPSGPRLVSWVHIAGRSSCCRNG